MLSFLLGGVYLVRGLFTDTQIEGWTSLIVLLSIFNGVTIALLSMLGEYVVRTLNAVSAQETYHVVERAVSEHRSRTRMTRDTCSSIGGATLRNHLCVALLDAHPDIAMARPAGRSPRSSCPTTWPGGASTGTE